MPVLNPPICLLCGERISHVGRYPGGLRRWHHLRPVSVQNIHFPLVAFVGDGLQRPERRA